MDKHVSHAKTVNGWELVLAAALFISPFVFQYTSGGASINDYSIGILVFILAGIRMFMTRTTLWAGWINLIMGLWLVFSPFILEFTSMAAIWTNVIIGAAITILSVIGVNESQKISHVVS